MPESQDDPPKLRGALYVDGFNLYWPIHDLGKPHLKWLNLWRLGEIFCHYTSADLVKVVFCTALPEDAPAKRQRHNTYNAALAASNVDVVKGHYVWDKSQSKFSEKQTDINVALSLIVDAQDDVFDIGYLLSADSDQAATGRFFRERYPQKKLVAVAPPGREPCAKLRAYANKSVRLQESDIEAAIFRGTVQGKNGLIVRPTEYDPPSGWVHPDDRPKKNSRNSN